MKAHTEVEVAELPKCDMCKQHGRNTTASYDAKTIFGAWGYLCELHFNKYGVGLGLGKGQRLVLKQRLEIT